MEPSCLLIHADAIAEPSVTVNLRRPFGWASSGDHSAIDWATAEQQGRSHAPGRNSRMFVSRDSAHPSEWEGKHRASDPQSAGRRMALNTVSQRDASGSHDAPFGLFRNARTVWEIPTEAFPEAHFATFPSELARRCIAAGSSELGVCPKCGGPWERVIVDTPEYTAFKAMERERKGTGMRGGSDLETLGLTRGTENKSVTASHKTIDWAATCSCQPVDPIPSLVLDPFGGSGTVAEVAFLMGRRAICLDLSLDYCRMAMQRVPPMASFPMMEIR